MKDPYIREKSTRERSAARKLAKEYFERFPKHRYQTEIESWRLLQSANIEFTMKRLREPIERALAAAVSIAWLNAWNGMSRALIKTASYLSGW
jgi:hypothetical protein